MPLFKSTTLAVIFAAATQGLAASPSPAPSPTPFDVPVPVGMPVNGIKVPHYDDTGRLALLIEADVAHKTDETTVEMENLRLEALDEDGRKIFVELPKSVLDLETRFLTGENNIQLRRDDFTITGDWIEFDTKKRHGTIRGNIRMVVSTETTSP